MGLLSFKGVPTADTLFYEKDEKTDVRVSRVMSPLFERRADSAPEAWKVFHHTVPGRTDDPEDNHSDE